MFTETPELIKELLQEGSSLRADVFKRANAAYPYGVNLWDAGTGNTLEIRLCKSLADAINSAKGEMKCSSSTPAATSAAKAPLR
jgi:hypothetical protein